MPEDTTSANAQAANADPAQAATSTDPQAGDSQNETISLEDARKLRSEAANLRKRMKAYEEAEAAAKAAQQTDQERLQAERDNLQSKYDSDTTALTERIVRYEVERQAAKLGIIDPDAAAQLIDWDQIEYDTDGTPKNADALLKDLLKNKPYLAGKAQASAGGATNPSRAQSNGSQITEQYVNDLLSGRLPQGTYEALSLGQRNEVQAILSKHRKY